MYSAVRKRVTYANVVLTLALVFAMSGGAYAAGKYLITSTKQISPKVIASLKGAKGATGATGATGPAGPAGAPGAVGKEGATGKEGTAGSNGGPGESVTSTSLAVKNTNCAQGGSEFVVSAKHTFACNGKEGSPWTAGGTLPAGRSETGAWGTSAPPGIFGASDLSYSPISFTIPLEAPTGGEQPIAKGHVHIIAVGGEGEGNGCPKKSTLAKPEAEPGNLCVFQSAAQVNINALEVVDPMTNEEEEAATTGTVVQIKADDPSSSVRVYGTWAVTAAE